MFRKRNQKGQASKREREADSGDEDDTSIVKKKKEKNALLSASTGGSKAKDADETAVTEKKGHVAFAASGSAASIVQDQATRILDVDGATEKEEPKILNGEEAEGLYKGLNGYTEYVNKKVEKTTQSNASKLRAGPLKGLTNVRISCRFDYQQDICKDYKETGFCGFGDSCVFMHDRGDYKTGWQLEQEWEEQQKQKVKERESAMRAEEEEDLEEEIEEDDSLPFTCPICNGDFKSPVVTKCQHFFCENCAIKHHTKSSKCFVCNTPTGGSFAVARDLLEKIAQRKKAMEERAAKIREKEEKEKEKEDEEEE
ncbi:hypothetical protein HDU97_004988 [Phlyctochytrium planicorne]|nr:hypothetical protein HDU97_004988 [Phlyctochytrium planicorne]